MPEVGNTADTPNPLGLHPYFNKGVRKFGKKKEIWESPRAKENLRVLRGSTSIILVLLSINVASSVFCLFDRENNRKAC